MAFESFAFLYHFAALMDIASGLMTLGAPAMMVIVLMLMAMFVGFRCRHGEDAPGAAAAAQNDNVAFAGEGAEAPLLSLIHI